MFRLTKHDRAPDAPPEWTDELRAEVEALASALFGLGLHGAVLVVGSTDGDPSHSGMQHGDPANVLTAFLVGIRTALVAVRENESLAEAHNLRAQIIDQLARMPITLPNEVPE